MKTLPAMAWKDGQEVNMGGGESYCMTSWPDLPANQRAVCGKKRGAQDERVRLPIATQLERFSTGLELPKAGCHTRSAERNGGQEGILAVALFIFGKFMVQEGTLEKN